MVIASGFHLFPFRTEKLSPVTPMILRKSGKVGSRHFFRRHPFSWVPFFLLLHRKALHLRIYTMKTNRAMKIKVLFFVLVMLPLSEIFYSCCNCTDETVYCTYLYESLYLKNLDNSGRVAIESESVEINKNAYGIRVYLTMIEPLYTKASAGKNSLFISSASAFSCECPSPFIYEPRDRVVSFKIYTLNDFDDNNPMNSDISSYFRDAYSYLDIGLLIDNLNETIEYINPRRETQIDLLLMTPPAILDVKHKFKVQLSFSSGRVLEQETEVELI